MHWEQLHHRDHRQVTHQAAKGQALALLTAAMTFIMIHTFNQCTGVMTRHQTHGNLQLQYIPGEELPKEVDQARQEVDQVLMIKNQRSPKPQQGFQEQPSEHLITNAL